MIICDIHQNRRSSGKMDGFRGCDKSMRGCDDFIARSDSCGAKTKVESIRTITNSDWIFCADKFIGKNEFEAKAKDFATVSVNSISFAVPGIKLLDTNGVTQFHKEFNDELNKIETEIRLEFHELLSKRFENVSRINFNAKKICAILQERKILTEDGKINLEPLEKYLI